MRLTNIRKKGIASPFIIVGVFLFLTGGAIAWTAISNIPRQPPPAQPQELVSAQQVDVPESNDNDYKQNPSGISASVKSESKIPNGGSYDQVLATDGNSNLYWKNDNNIPPASSDLVVKSIKTTEGVTFAGTVSFDKYTFPTSDGSSNQLLKTDGAGKLVWASDNDSSIGSTLDITDLTINGSLTSKGTTKIGTYTLPSVDGSANQVLKTNGSGVLSWTEDLNTSLGSTLSLQTLSVSSSFTSTGITTIGEYTLPITDGASGQVLKTNGSGTLSWQTDNSSTDSVTVGKTGSGADYIADGTADDVQIQAAINAVVSAGGGVVKILSGVYDIRTMIAIPKDPKIRIEGEYVTKFGYGGTELRAYSGLATPLVAIIKEAGNEIANTSNSDHSHASQYSKIIFNGNSNKADVGLLLYNTDHTLVSDCKFVGSPIALDGQFNGEVSLADYAGGMRVERSSFLASNINIRLNSHTQDWITDSWFLGSPNTHIHFIKSNKIHLSNNEFNQVSQQAFIFDDDPTGNDPTLATGSINITGGFIDAGAGKYFWVDNRTNTSSKGIIVEGVRLGTGTKTKLFQQAKDYQVNTYTAANLVGGYVYPDFDDDVALMNATSDVLQVQLPPATSATKNILIKPINLANAVTIYPDGSDSIEKDGVLSASYAFSEVNESVWLTPDANKWRVLSTHKPTGGAVSGSATENVTEVASATYTVAADKDIILVNAASNAVALTLPSKSSKYSNPRKNLVIKVISATNPITITAAGADEIDTPGTTNVTINDLRAVTFVANSGSRWRTFSSQIVAGSTKAVQFNNAGILGANSNFAWDNTNSRLGVLAANPASTLDIGGSLGYKRTAVSSSVSSGAQIVLGVTSTSSPYTINLRTVDCVAGRVYIVKDESGAAGTNNITVATEGSEKIDGQDTYVINTNYGSVTVYSNGSNWFVISRM